MRSSKARATEEDVRRFISAIAPSAPDLYIAAFDEKTALNDAVDLIEGLRAENNRLRQYTAHKVDCDSNFEWTDKRCNCGLSAALEPKPDNSPEVAE